MVTTELRSFCPQSGMRWIKHVIAAELQHIQTARRNFASATRLLCRHFTSRDTAEPENLVGDGK